MPVSRCSARRQPVPAVHVDPDEDRLDEERDALDREAEPEDVTERGHEVRPQEAHLEAQDRARDDTDRKEREHHLGPASREHAIELVTRAQVEPLCEDHEGGECDPEADQRDVRRERERLHLSRLEQVVLVRRAECRGRGARHVGDQRVHHSRRRLDSWVVTTAPAYVLRGRARRRRASAITYPASSHFGPSSRGSARSAHWSTNRARAASRPTAPARSAPRVPCRARRPTGRRS